MFGLLGFDDLPHDPIAWGGALSVIGGGIAVVALITFLKRWKWLYKEWLTSLDPKKIGVMYIIVAVVMLLRGLGDAATDNRQCPAPRDRIVRQVVKSKQAEHQ